MTTVNGMGGVEPQTAVFNPKITDASKGGKGGVVNVA